MSPWQVIDHIADLRGGVSPWQVIDHIADLQNERGRVPLASLGEDGEDPPPVARPPPHLSTQALHHQHHGDVLQGRRGVEHTCVCVCA